MTAPTIIGDCTLYLGDCIDILPTLGKVDAVVTDPPWNMGYFENDSMQWCDYADWLQELNSKYKELDPQAVIVFLSSKSIPYVSHVYSHWQPFVAVKNFSQMSKSKDTIPNAFDVGFALINGVYTGSGRNWFLCNTAGMLSERTGHPTPRTIDAMQQVLDWITSKTILDPFMGSGTTGVACIRTGRKFIGIEKEPKYFDIACKRIKAEYERTALFEPPPMVVVPTLFPMEGSPCEQS